MDFTMAKGADMMQLGIFLIAVVIMIALAIWGHP